MLRRPSDLHDRKLSQGDIIADVPFLILPRTINIKSSASGQIRLESSDPRTFDRLRQPTELKNLQTTVAVVLQMGVVISQSCDLDYKDHFALARVFPLQDLIKAAKDAIEHSEPLVLFDTVRVLAEGAEYGHLAYLGVPDGSTRMVADLLRVQSFPQHWKACFRQRRVAALDDEGLRYFQGRLVASSGRYAAQDRFWMASGDHAVADQLVDEPGLLDEAYDRLRAKTNATGTKG